MSRIFSPSARRLVRRTCLVLFSLCVSWLSGAAAAEPDRVLDRLATVELLAFEVSDGRVVMRVGDGEPTVVGEGDTLPGLPEASLVEVLARRLVVDLSEPGRPGLQVWLEPLDGRQDKAETRCRVTAVDPNRPRPPVLPLPSQSLPVPVGEAPETGGEG